MGAALIATQLPAYTAQAAWMPDHQIPAYQQKDIFSEETVTIKGLDVEEVVNAKVSPVVTKSMEKNVKFVIFNSTKQKVEQEVTCTDGKLPDLKLVKNHNYIIEASDSEYYMPNVYVWVKDNKLVDIKKNVDTSEYPEVDTLSLYKRDQAVENPAEDQRVRSNIEVYTQQGGALYNVKFKLTSNVETLEASTGNSGKLTVDLLEDVVYMVTAENSNYAVESFPLVIKDKSEYGARKYTYDFSSCAKVDDIYMVNKSDAHKNDTVLTNTNYGEIYKDVYTGIEGNTTITGMNFKDFLVLDRKLDKSTVTGMDGKDYDVLDIKVVNPHRWEIAYLAAGEYKVTEKLDSNKTVSNVYYVDGDQKLQPVEFSQSGQNVTFSMSTLSMYPVVIEYSSGTQEADKSVLKLKVVDEKGNPVSGLGLYLKSELYSPNGDLAIAKATDESGKASYTYTGDEFGDDTYTVTLKDNSGYEIVTTKEITFDEDEECIATVDDEDYDGSEVEIVVKKTGGSEPEEPEADKSVLKLRVVDEKGNPVSGLGLYLKSELYSPRGDLAITGATDATGKTSYRYSGKELGDDTYTVTLKDNSSYEIVTTKEITFDEDEECIATVDDKDYDGSEVVIVVKKLGGSEPEVDRSTLTLKVLNDNKKPVSGIKMELVPQSGDKKLTSETNDAGMVVYTPDSEGTYTLQPAADSGYTCKNPITLETAKDEAGKYYIKKVNDKEFDGKEVTFTVTKIETEINEIIPSISEISAKGGEVTVTVKGTALPQKMYYAVNYILTGTYTEEEREAITAQEVETKGSDTERTFTITLPDASKYKGILRWKIGVTDTDPEDGYYYAKQQITIKKVVETGWQKVEGKWYYLDENGEKQTDWQKVDGKWYYLDKDGVMQTGWQKINGKWYYMNASGAMLTGWQKIGGKWYYMNTSGAMQTGWQKISGKWYYMNTSGAMLTGWQKISGKWYYMNPSGAMLTGWQKIGGKWYYMNTSGAMQTGWLKLGNKWYYLNASGAMVTGSQKIGGKWYRFNASGVWIK